MHLPTELAQSPDIVLILLAIERNRAEDGITAIINLSFQVDEDVFVEVYFRFQ